MYIFANIGFLFICGGLIGATLEYVFTYLFVYKKPFKPGFFFSFFTPIYGIGFLFTQSIFNATWFNSLNNIYLDVFLKILILSIGATLIEYITGLLYLKIYKTRLWDYSKDKFNIQGIINPLYSLFWIIIALCYYFAVFRLFNAFFKIANNNIAYFISVLVILIYFFLDFVLSTICCVRNKNVFNKLDLNYVLFKDTLYKIYGCSYVIKLLKGIDIKEYKKDKAKLNKEKSNYLIAN